MLPHMRRGLTRLQQRLDAEKDLEVRLKLEEEISLRLEGFCKADAAIQAAVVPPRTEFTGPIESTAAPRTSAEWVRAMTREASAQERTIGPDANQFARAEDGFFANADPTALGC